MSSSRGDRKPCTEVTCVGTMQFGREPQPTAAAGVLLERDWGWSCDSNPGHFRRDAADSAPVRTDAVADGIWDDDGAPPAGAHRRR